MLECAWSMVSKFRKEWKQKRIEGYTSKVGRDELQRSHESKVTSEKLDGAGSYVN